MDKLLYERKVIIYLNIGLFTLATIIACVWIYFQKNFYEILEGIIFYIFMQVMFLMAFFDNKKALEILQNKIDEYEKEIKDLEDYWNHIQAFEEPEEQVNKEEFKEFLKECGIDPNYFEDNLDTEKNER